MKMIASTLVLLAVLAGVAATSVSAEPNVGSRDRYLQQDTQRN